MVLHGVNAVASRQETVALFLVVRWRRVTYFVNSDLERAQSEAVAETVPGGLEVDFRVNPDDLYGVHASGRPCRDQIEPRRALAHKLSTQHGWEHSAAAQDHVSCVIASKWI